MKVCGGGMRQKGVCEGVRWDGHCCAYEDRCNDIHCHKHQNEKRRSNGDTARDEGIREKRVEHVVEEPQAGRMEGIRGGRGARGGIILPFLVMRVHLCGVGLDVGRDRRVERVPDRLRRVEGRRCE